MKKYLIQGMLALAATLMLTGCHDEDMYSGSTLDQKAKAYEETFVEAFGMPNKNHTWGFGTTGTTRTRTVLKEDDWDNDAKNATLVAIINNKPASITSGERQYVEWWFKNNPGYTAGADIKNYYLQYVYGQASQVYNVYWNHYDQNYMNNNPGATSNYYRDDFTKTATMDYLEVGDGTTYDHISDFNANGGGPWDIVYVQNGSALDFKYKSSWSSETHNLFKLAHVTGTADDGTAVDGWYVGLAMFGEKSDNGDQKLNNDSVTYCDDWIFKIVPGEGETITPPVESTKPKVTVVDLKYRETIITETTTESYKTKKLLKQGRVLCEDLGSSGHTDIDFNDLVFDAKVWEHTKVETTTVKITHKEGAKVTKTEEPDPTVKTAIGYENNIAVLAAGGTLPLSFAQKGELNGLFEGDFDYLTMINTVTDQQLAPGSKSDTAAPVEFTLKGSGAYSSINQIPIWVEFGKETKKLNQVFGNEEGSTGYIPRCLLVPLGTPWATERTPIDEAYADFSDYVQNMKDCWDYAAPSAVYPGSDAMGLKAEPEEAYEVVKYDIVEPTTTTDTQDGGEYYDYHEIEVDQVVPEMVGTSLKIEGAGPLKQYYDTKRIDDSYAYIRGEEFPKTGHVTLRIYGIGADNDGYLWRLYTGTANSNLGGGDGTQYSYNNEAGRTSLAANGYIETTVEAATLNSTGWYLAGCNFTLRGVTIVTEDDLKEDTGTTDNPLSIVEGNTLEGTNLLSNSISLNNDGVKPVVSKQSDAKTYAQSLKAGESALAILLTITNDVWYFQTGLSGTSGNDLIEQQSNNNTSFKNGDTIILTRILSAAEIETLTNNANNQYYWGGGMFGIQGNGVTVSKMVIQ